MTEFLKPSLEVITYGGSFNPPHFGHVFSLCYAASLKIPNIIVVPCATHPYGKPLVDFEHRYQMCKLAFGWIPGIKVSRIDYELNTLLGRQVFAYDTVTELCQQYKTEKILLLVGGDVAKDMVNWHLGKELAKLVKPVILDRHDKNSIIPDISSTEVRGDIAWSKRSPDQPRIARAPTNVLEYIELHGLYV